MNPRQRSYGQKARTLDQCRAFAVQLVTMKRTLDGFTAEDLARASGLGLPEAAALLARQRMIRAPRNV